jgi:demethylmenaquinone methyltransferase/2-methoxy-6-polyprenyl-1,4-benzoquinol methylase
MNPLRSFFEQLAQEWDSSQPADRESIIHGLLSQFDEPLSHSRKILDVGTGTGALIPILSRRYPQSKIYSIDFAHQMCVRASHRRPSTQVIQGDVHYLPFSDLSFDTVICHNSFPHFKIKERVIKNFKRILGRSGKLFIIHDISRNRVNEIHANAHAEVIHQDLLPEAGKLSKLLIDAGFNPKIVEDVDTHFVIYANSN